VCSKKSQPKAYETTAKKLVTQIEILEKQITENEDIIKHSASQKQAVLKNYL